MNLVPLRFQKGQKMTVLFSAFLGSLFLIVLYADNASAQNGGDINKQQDMNMTSNSTNASSSPVLEEKSEMGLYNVLLKKAQSEIVPSEGIEFEITFLNASIPSPTSQNVPQKETNETGFSTPGASGFNAPSVINPVAAIESYDITVYSDSGKELWSATESPANGGMGLERVTFGNYTGPITIEIRNIKPLQQIFPQGATGQDGKDGITDMVRFTTSVD